MLESTKEKLHIVHQPSKCKTTVRGFVWSKGSGIGLTLELLIAKDTFKNKKENLFDKVSKSNILKDTYQESTKTQHEIQELSLCSSI